MATILENAQKMISGEAPPPPVSRLIGFQLVAVEPGHAHVLASTPTSVITTRWERLHGGVLRDIADVAMGTRLRLDARARARRSPRWS